jgi:hypothetical protein
MGIVDSINDGSIIMKNLVISKEKDPKETVQEDFSQLVQEQKTECIARIQSGESEPSFQIGSGSYTETEWNNLLKNFDLAESKLREAVEGTEQERPETIESESSAEDDVSEESIEMLLAEVTTATYPSNDDSKDDVYYTFYTPNGIYCRKQGQSELEWEIPLEDKSQYDKVISYLQSMESQDNFRFACHENFWQDFLSGQLDVDKFNDFLETRVVDGVPNYLNVFENGVNIDKEAAGYSKYMNKPDFVGEIYYTLEEVLEASKRSTSANKQSNHEVIDKNHLEDYYAKHPNEIGQRNHYYNGRWYSMSELVEIWDKELAELFEQTAD